MLRFLMMNQPIVHIKALQAVVVAANNVTMEDPLRGEVFLMVTLEISGAAEGTETEGAEVLPGAAVLLGDSTVAYLAVES
jgi:hypothetical protein